MTPQEEPKQVRCYDKFNQLLKESDYVDVQRDGVHLIYKKEDGEEDKVSAYAIGVEEGAKWQAERMYSEKDMHKDSKPFCVLKCKLHINEWREQYKKK
jgi:hypothetical protein